MWSSLAKEYTHSPWPQRFDQGEHVKQTEPIRIAHRTLTLKLLLNSGEWRTGGAEGHFRHQVDTDNASNVGESGTQVWRETRLWRPSSSPFTRLLQKPAPGLWHELTCPLFIQVPYLVWLGSSVTWNQKALLEPIQMYSSEIIFVRLFLKSKPLFP